VIAHAAAAHRTLRYAARQTWRWVRRHPRWTSFLMLFAVWAVSAAIAMPAAYADGASQNASNTLPFLPPLTAKDSNGVPLVNYAVLPLNRGDVWHPQQIWISGLIDSVWSTHLTTFLWVLWLLQFLLAFTWIDWIATPLNDIATVLHATLGDLTWPALALSAAGLVGGILIMRGKVAQGSADIAVSVLCAALAVGVLANPVETITGDHGALAWSEANGANLSASVLSPDNTAPTGEPDKKQAADLVSDSLSGGLIDVFVRAPAQEIAFGHALSGDCDTTFTQQMKKQSPYDTSSTSVRDAVGKCDEAAKDYVTHTSIGQVITAVTIASGSGALFGLAAGLAFAYLLSVMWTLWKAIKTGIAVNLAIAPGTARQMLWRSFIGMWVGALFVGGIAVILAGYLRILTSVMGFASKAGLTIVAQTGIINFVVIAFVISLIWFFVHSRKTGHELADRLAKLGLGGEGSQMSPLTSETLRQVPRYAYDAWKRRSPKPKPAVGQSPEPEPVDAGHLTSTPSTRRPDCRPGARPAGALPAVAKAALTVGKVAAAGASGGTSAVVMKTASLAGKKVLQQHALPALNRNVLNRKVGSGPTRPSLPSGTPAGKPTGVAGAPATPFGRRIVVGTDGTGRVEPRRPNSAGVYRVTQMPKPPRRVSPSPVRAALERAAAQQAGPTP